MRPTDDEFVILDQEVTELHVRWNFLKDLFTEEDSVEVLNNCAPAAFETVREVFLDSVILGICRIAADKSRQTLTIKKLQSNHDGTDLGVSLAKVLEQLKPLTDPLAKHRNERIAHHNTALAKRTITLPKITKDCIDRALHLLTEFMNEISTTCDATAICYEKPITSGDGTDIVLSLRYAQKCDSLCQRAWRGEPAETLIKELKKL